MEDRNTNQLFGSTSAMTRWTVLVLASVVMMMGYIFWDILSPLSTLIKSPAINGGLGWTMEEYGFFAGSYSFFNVFLLMLFWGGILLDRLGVRFTGVFATGMMLLGACICQYAMTHSEIETGNISTMVNRVSGLMLKPQVIIAAIGFGIFGAGCDITGITISKVIIKWFSGHELATAMGIQVALARTGTALAISMSPLIALNYGLVSPVRIGVLLLFTALLLFIVYIVIFDRKQSSNPQNKISHTEGQTAEKTQQRSGNQQLIGFLLIVLLCVLFYSSIRPFLKFATDVMINKYGMDAVTAGWITAILPYGTIVLTPLFGNIFDRLGHGITLMFVGCLITTVCHFILSLPLANSSICAIGVMTMLGVSFSLVPSAMWASIPQLVSYKRLGIGYAVIFYIQNLGLMLVPIIIGRSIDNNTLTLADGSLQIDFTQPMGLFTAIAASATLITVLLFLADKKYKWGLQQPNIEKKL